MAMGGEGELVLGSVVEGRGRVVFIDGQGQLTGQYRGSDGTGCHPASLCFAGDGKVNITGTLSSVNRSPIRPIIDRFFVCLFFVVVVLVLIGF
jgi:hypothetical protein